jgi:hypothetical protein
MVQKQDEEQTYPFPLKINLEVAYMTFVYILLVRISNVTMFSCKGGWNMWSMVGWLVGWKFPSTEEGQNEGKLNIACHNFQMFWKKLLEIKNKAIY